MSHSNASESSEMVWTTSMMWNGEKMTAYAPVGMSFREFSKTLMTGNLWDTVRLHFVKVVPPNWYPNKAYIVAMYDNQPSRSPL